MAIANVNGRNVYVITSDPVKHATTSTGTSWAQYTTSLRWQNWEQVQKSVAASMEREGKIYSEQSDLYRAQRKELSRQIDAVNTDISQLNAGELKAHDAASRAQATQIAIEGRSRRSAQISADRSARSSARAGAHDDNLSGAAEVAVNTAVGQYRENPTSRNMANYVENMQNNVGDQSEAANYTVIARAIEIERNANAGMTFDEAEANVLSNFGSEPGLTTALDDYRALRPQAIEAASGVTAQPVSGAGTPRGRVASRAAERQRLINQRTALEEQLRGLRAPTAPTGDLLSRTQRQFAKIDRPSAARDINAYEQALRSMQPFIDAETSRLPEGFTAQEEADARRVGAQNALLFAANRDPRNLVEGFEGTTPDDIINGVLERLREGAGTAVDGVKSGAQGVVDYLRPGFEEPSVVDQLPDGDIEDLRSPDDPFPIQENVAPELEGEGVNLITGETIPEPASGADLVLQATQQDLERDWIEQNPWRSGPRESGLTAEQWEKITDPPVDKQTLTPDKQTLTPDKLPTELPASQQTKETRVKAYQQEFIRGGQRLASKRRKFKRISKPDLPREERQGQVPEYVILVDDLYDPDNVDIPHITSEINKAYRDDPETRQQAHEYAIAKDIIETNVQQPTLQDE